MTRFTKIRTIMLTLFLLLGSIPASAVERPFAINGAGVAPFILDEAGNIIGANATGSGTGTHVGSWTVSGTVTFTPDNGVLRSRAEVSIIAANGDKLDVVLEGELNTATGTDQGVMSIVGGTGRFENASGSANFVVTLNPVTGGFNLTAVGRINY